MDGSDNARCCAGSRIGRILGVFLLVAVLAGGGFLAYWMLRPEQATATALFEVSFENDDKAFDDVAFEILKKTQLALLRSNFVLTAALRNPSTHGLSVLAGRSEPIEWLQDNLQVEYPQNGTILSISLRGDKSQDDELVKIVDAVAKAYKDEVVAERRQRRLLRRDVLAMSLENLNKDIKRDFETYLDIAKESGRPEGGSEALQQLDIKRLDRIEDEVMRLESELAIDGKNDAEKRKAVEQRISQLRDQQTNLTKELAMRTARSSDLEIRDRRIKELQQVANELSRKLEAMDMEMNAYSDQIRQVQPAVVAHN